VLQDRIISIAQSESIHAGCISGRG
jgi:hypothetical protein